MRVRILPLTMFFAALMLSVKIGDLWNGVRVAELHAQQADDGEGSGVGEAGAADGLEAPDEQAPEAAEPSLEELLEPAPELTQAELDVLQSLRKRREALDAREAELGLRESMIKAAEHNFEARIEEWKRLKAEVEALLARYETDRNEELETLAAYYEKMKPKDAARVFDALDLPYLIQIVGRMKEAKVADIIGKMDTLRAKTLTMELARRRDPSVLVEETAVR
jgi:flagellar motility protein MotE (MotC chaperone)